MESTETSAEFSAKEPAEVTPPGATTPAGPAGRRRLSDARRARRRRQRRLGWVMLGLGAFIVAAGAWVAVTGLMARHQLTAVKGDLTQLQADISSGDVGDAKLVATDLSRHAHSAHSLTTGPAWWVGAKLPGVGDPLRTARGVSAAADSLGSGAVPKLVDLSAALDPSRFRLKNHQLDIAPLIAATPELNSVVTNAHQQLQLIAALPHRTWLAPMNTGVTEVSAKLGRLVGSLDTIDQVARAAPAMLGYRTPQRYFVAFQNEDETRGTGGLPGAFAIVVANHGKLTFTHFGSDTEMEGIDSGLDLGSDYNRNWANFEPTAQYLNSNVDPDFHYAAQIWAAMWQKKTGQHVNGAVAIDPTALSYFLGVTGPATMVDGTQITSANIVRLTQNTVYTKFTDQAKRKAYLLEIAGTAEQRILGGTTNAKGLFRAAAKAAGQRRLLLWTEQKPVESFLRTTTVGGAIPDTAAPYAQATVVNYGANKDDYYLDTAVRWQSQGCGASREVTVTVTLRNNTPAGLSDYLAYRPDKPGAPVGVRENRTLLYYVGTQGGGLERITVNGRVGAVMSGTAGVHPTYAALVPIPRGRTQTVVLTLLEPGTSAAPVVVLQPHIRPMTFSARTASCG